MATALKLKLDIKKLKAAINSKATPKSFLPKLKSQLEKSEKELEEVKKTGKPPKKTTTSGNEQTLTALQKLIQKKKYKAYQGQGVDLEKDAKEGAFATGRRVSKGLKANQYGDKKDNKGNVYYEYRPNRLDVKQPKKAQKYPKLEKGGYMAKGGINYDLYANKSIEYVEGEIAHTERSARQFRQAGDEKSANDRDAHAKKLWEIYYGKREQSKMADGGYMAKGGGVSSKSTYVPNRDVTELSLILNKELKTIKGSDIFDGVYVKNSALSKLKARKAAKKSASPKTTLGVDDAYSKVVAKAKEYDIKAKYIRENVKKEHINTLIKAGLDLKDLYVVYFGIQTLSPTTDLSYNSSGLMKISADYVKRSVDRIATAVKENKFEIGLKYPEINWAAIIKKYGIQKEPTTIKGAVTDFGSEKQNYVYAIYKGKNVVVGTSIDRERYIDGKLDKDDYFKRDAPVNGKFEGGYWGIVTSSKEVMYDIAKMILSQKNGYVKDMELFINGLGGVHASALDLNKVEYEDGGYMAGGGETEMQFKVYKLRAEGINDFINFIGTGIYFNINWFKVEIDKLGLPDVVVSFETELPLSYLKSKLREVADSHVMLDTIKPIKQYTGERYANGGYMAKGGGIYSSEELYIVKVFDGKSGELLDMSKRVWAKNISQAQIMAMEDFEDEMKAKYGDHLRFKVEEAPSMMSKGGELHRMEGGE